MLAGVVFEQVELTQVEQEFVFGSAVFSVGSDQLDVSVFV